MAVASSIFLLWCGLTANGHNSFFEKYGLVSLPKTHYETRNDLSWQHADGAAIVTDKHPCPPGGCTWEMCNPFATEALTVDTKTKAVKIGNAKLTHSNTTTPIKFHHGDLNDPATPAELSWAQPTYCFSYNRTYTRCYALSVDIHPPTLIRRKQP